MDSSKAEASASPRGSGLHDVIVTLPVAAIVALSLIVIAAMGAAVAVLLRGPDSLQGPAGQALVVLLPMLFAVAAAIGIRRTSTKQIDELVARFLERTVQDRLQLACRDHASTAYPFRRADLVQRAGGRSYVSYRLDWADGFAEPARVDVKMNVFNIELVAELHIDAEQLGQALEPGVELIDRATLHHIKDHALLRRFHASLQGAIEEGYAIRIGIHPEGAQRVRLQFSLRQKMQEHFLASPYLKRYFAEDLAIAVGVIYNELRDSGLRARSHLELTA
jgi:hypothetical protein